MKNENKKCPVCGSNPLKKELELCDYRLCVQGRTVYLICSSCRTVYQKNPISEADLKKHYPTGYSYHSKKKRKRIFKPMFSFLIKPLMGPLERYYPESNRKEQSILDVGCGTGDYILSLKTKGFKDVEGIEISTAASGIAKKTGIKVYNVSLENFKTSKRYDIIILNQVFEHFKNPALALKKLSALIKEDGIIILSFPNNHSFAAVIFGKYWPGYDAPRHYFTYNTKSATILFNKCGFNIVKVRHISRPSQFTGSLQYISNKITGRKTVLEEGYFRNSVLFDLIFFPLAYLLNLLRIGDNVEIYIKRCNLFDKRLRKI